MVTYSLETRIYYTDPIISHKITKIWWGNNFSSNTNVRGGRVNGTKKRRKKLVNNICHTKYE